MKRVTLNNVKHSVFKNEEDVKVFSLFFKCYSSDMCLQYITGK